MCSPPASLPCTDRAAPAARLRSPLQGDPAARRLALGAVACAVAVAAGAAARPASGSTPSLQRALALADAVTEGNGPLQLAVFFDLQCPVCAHLHALSRAALETGAWRFTWMAVALLGPDSLWRAARWRAQASGAASLAAAFGDARALRPPLPPAAALDAARDAVLGNTALLRLLVSPRAALTPSMVWSPAMGPARWMEGISPALERTLRSAGRAG